MAIKGYSAQAESLQHSPEKVAGGIGPHDKFIYIGSRVTSMENDINMCQAKAWSAIDRLSVILKSNLSDKIKRNFFQEVVVSILLYECTTWTLTKRREKNLDSNCTRMLRVILNKSWKHHPTKHQLYGYLPPISKTIQIWRIRPVGYCKRSKDEIMKLFPVDASHERAGVGRPARTYLPQLWKDRKCKCDGRSRRMPSQWNLF